jgi:peptidoglycan/xylan/chitin deacetylase (PgdA/CDA1 family)
MGGLRPFHWGVRDRLLILMYHRFSAEPHHSRVSAGQFREHLEYLRTHANPVSLREGLDALASGKSMPPNPVVITIDDGYRDTYEIALPLLDEFGFNATLFAVTDFLDGQSWIWTDLMRFVLSQAGMSGPRMLRTAAGEFHLKGNDPYGDAETVNARLKKIPNGLKDAAIREMAETLNVEIPTQPTREFAAVSWAEVAEMDSTRIQVESHTASHPILTNINKGEVDHELVSSKARLEGMLKREVNYFCYPNGDLNDDVREAVIRAGYRAALTTRFGFNTSKFDPFLVDRIPAPSLIQDFAQSASGFESFKQTTRGMRSSES